MSTHVVLFTERREFEREWRDALGRAGLDVHVSAPDVVTDALERDLAYVLDGSWPGFDEDELLASVGYARAIGSYGAVVLPRTGRLGSIEDLLHEICGGLVLREGDDPSRVAQMVARRADCDRLTRFEYFTVAPRGEALLAILGDGTSALLPRPLSDEDDGSDVAGIELGDDASTATMELASGRRLQITGSAVAAARAATRHVPHDGVNGVEVDGVRLGQRLKALRLAAGLTQAELARRTGIHRPNIARVEAGRHTPSLETIARLASAIGVSTTRVLSED